ncbi:hypothetical protein KV100_12715 [Mumia sp. zg.B21]|uniref:hypothetical protein n=1 Tax=Mumia sp. zg.B21 TaxID=2855447 RepID=UPI001C6E798F|nr:hypothetical protein [Mumia sp. zg.B21]MBW9210516.1 hypothetical protein [Mumia sp. zg.B21]
MGMVRTVQPISRCQHCGAPLPPAAATGRTRIYCRPACRKAAYEQRRAKKPGAVRVQVVERVVVETRRGHLITDCADRVTDSQHAVEYVIDNLTALARIHHWTRDPRWRGVLRAVDDLNTAIADHERHTPTPRR